MRNKGEQHPLPPISLTPEKQKPAKENSGNGKNKKNSNLPTFMSEDEEIMRTIKGRHDKRPDPLNQSGLEAEGTAIEKEVVKLSEKKAHTPR